MKAHKHVKCLVMFSAGLDSTIAAHLLKQQGLEVLGLHFVLPFCSGMGRKHTEVRRAAQRLGMPLRVEEEGAEFLSMVKSPSFGYGKNANPCLDCRIFRLKRAMEIMHEEGASFIATGEVVGQRPMSQRMDCLYKIEKDTGLRGLLLRPLSAKLLRPTVPEERQWVDREKLLGFSGRSRKPQLAYAREHGLSFESPAGGCILTTPGTAVRFTDLMNNQPGFDLDDFRLIAYGRHFRFDETTKLIVGRDHRENEILEQLVESEDAKLYMADIEGPVAVLRGDCTEDRIQLSASMTARFSKARDQSTVRVQVERLGTTRVIEIAPADDTTCDKLRVH